MEKPMDITASRPVVSVVIPALDSAATIGEQLHALAHQDTMDTYEVLIADNGSTDGTPDVVREYIRRYPGRFRLVDASARHSTNYARNTGARDARGDLLLYCDADDVVSLTWIAANVEASKVYDLWGGCLDDTRLNDSFRPAGKPLVMSALPIEFDFLPYAVGASMGMHRSVLDTIGDWNEDYDFAGGDDVELSWRVQLKGFKIGFCRAAVVHYRLRKSYAQAFRQAYGYGLAGPKLLADFGDHGLKSRPLRDLLEAARIIVSLLPLAAVSHSGRVKLVRRFGFLVGRVVGSFRCKRAYFRIPA